MQRIYQASNLPEAYLLQGLLQREGIEVLVFNENAQGALGEIPFIHAFPELWLANTAQYDSAMKLIAAYEHSNTESRYCPECGEENPKTFELCWHCGVKLP